jgi:hypothetical protein
MIFSLFSADIKPSSLTQFTETFQRTVGEFQSKPFLREPRPPDTRENYLESEQQQLIQKLKSVSVPQGSEHINTATLAAIHHPVRIVAGNLTNIARH